MVKKKESQPEPFLTDEEVEDLQQLKKVTKTVKKPTKKQQEKVEKVMEVIKDIDFSKPPTKELSKKIHDVVEPPEKPEALLKKKIELEKKKNSAPAPSVKPVKSPDLEYILKETTRYDLNWYYMKEKLVAFKKWFLTPYTLYANWFNKKFNSPKIVKSVPEIEMEEDFESMEDIFEKVKQEKIEPLKIARAKIPIVTEDVSMIEIEKAVSEMFDELKPIMIKKVHDKMVSKSPVGTRKIIIKGG